jgi:molecular chaperone DnaK (HSP70)
MTQYLITVGDKVFMATLDIDRMIKRAEEHLDYNAEEEGYLDYNASSRTGDNEYTSQENYEKDINQLIKDLEEIKEKPQLLKKMIDNMGKKKDGYLKKGAVSIYSSYPHTTYHWEDSWCYVMMAIRGKALSHNEIEVTLNESEKYSY